MYFFLLLQSKKAKIDRLDLAMSTSKRTPIDLSTRHRRVLTEGDGSIYLKLVVEHINNFSYIIFYYYLVINTLYVRFSLML